MLHNKIIFKTKDNAWHLHFLKSGKPYITKELTLNRLNKWLRS